MLRDEHLAGVGMLEAGDRKVPVQFPLQRRVRGQGIDGQHCFNVITWLCQKGGSETLRLFTTMFWPVSAFLMEMKFDDVTSAAGFF